MTRLSVDDALSLARKLVQSRKYADAGKLCQQVLQLEPGQHLAYNILGLISFQSGDTRQAEAFVRKAISLSPLPGYYNSLAVYLARMKRFDEAEIAVRESLSRDPSKAGAWINLGNILHSSGRFREAVDAYQHSAAVKESADAYSNMGNTLRELKDYDTALKAHDKAIALGPQSANRHYNRACVLKDCGRVEEAIDDYRQALTLRPDYHEAENNLGNALTELGHLEQALEAYQRALSLQPNYPEVECNLGKMWQAWGDPAKACQHYDRAIALRPGFAEAHKNRAMAWLIQDDLKRGWHEYEWRWQTKEFQRTMPPVPLWDGSELRGRRILLHYEQGIGDTLQFIRFASVVKQRGGHVLVCCQPELVELLQGCSAIDELYEQGAPIPRFDVHAPLLSLPYLLGVESYSVDVPYIHVPNAYVEKWQQKLAGVNGFRVGIVWQGNPGHQEDRRRSVRLAEFASLAPVEGVRLVSLQKGAGSEQLPRASFDILDVGASLQSFCDTAAAIKHLDLVISVDTAVVHLAGAMNFPTWVALAFAPDFRWLLERDDSPWYPSTRLFRQKRRGEWPEVFQRMADALKSLQRDVNCARHPEAFPPEPS